MEIKVNVKDVYWARIMHLRQLAVTLSWLWLSDQVGNQNERLPKVTLTKLIKCTDLKEKGRLCSVAGDNETKWTSNIGVFCWHIAQVLSLQVFLLSVLERYLGQVLQSGEETLLTEHTSLLEHIFIW